MAKNSDARTMTFVRLNVICYCIAHGYPEDVGAWSELEKIFLDTVPEELKATFLRTVPMKEAQRMINQTRADPGPALRFFDGVEAGTIKDYAAYYREQHGK